MAVDLSDYVDTLRREISLPTGELFSVSDDYLVGCLADGFWEAVIDQLITGYTCDADGIVTATTAATEFPREQVAVVVLYAGLKILRNQLINTKTRTTAKAGPVEYTTETGSNVITTMMKQLNEVKNRLLYITQYGNTEFFILDAFSARQASPLSYHGHLYDVFNDAFGDLMPQTPTEL